MTLHPDDPRLTAYALGELPESERAAIETELQQSPECRDIVDEIRRTADRLSNELAAEPCPELSANHKDAIAEQLLPANVVPLPRRRVFARAVVAMAACAAVVIAWQVWGPLEKKNAQVANLPVSPERKVPVLNPAPAPGPAVPVAQPVTTVSGPSVTAGSTTLAQNSSTLNKREPTVTWAMVDDTIHTPETPANTVKLSNGVLADGLKQAESAQLVGAANAPQGNASTLTLSSLDTKSPALQQQNGQPPAVADPAGHPIDFAFKAKPESQVAQTAQKPQEAKDASGIYSVTIQGFGGVPQPQSQASTATPLGIRGGGGGGGGFGGGGGAGGRGGSAAIAQNNTAGGARPVMLYRENRSLVLLDSESEERLLRDKTPILGDTPYYSAAFRSRRMAETASYPRLIENTFSTVLNTPLSTFSIDVDTASYANVRRFLNERRLPPRDAVRIEEMVNYFTYRYPAPRGDDPFAASIEVAGCPWDSEHRLVRVGLKGREIQRDKRPASNFVFLIDVSGSMQPRERLPLIKEALRQLVKKMTENDRVAVVVYASEAGIRLESTPCSKKERILQVIDELEAGGSTNGGDGIRQAYRLAEEHFIREGVNRVLLCTDGDFNVGVTDQNELVRMIQEKAKSGVFLTTLGVGTDNYKDALMQQIADRGNGNYHYLDSLEEAQKVLIEQMNGTLVTIAKDVKIQIEFNPAQVSSYRLIGYEKRLLHKEDFNNDAKDAGEIGAGHTVTALYEIVPAGKEPSSAVDDLKYQTAEQKPERYATLTGSKELLTLKVRYKQPDGDKSKLLEVPITDNGKRFSGASDDFKFATAVAAFGMLMRESEYKGTATYATILEWAESAKGADEEGYRSEFLNLVRKARDLR